MSATIIAMTTISAVREILTARIEHTDIDGTIAGTPG